jgi:hypothetical protein
VAHAHQFPDEDKAMRVTCYLVFAPAVVVWVGLLLYKIWL